MILWPADSPFTIYSVFKNKVLKLKIKFMKLIFDIPKHWAAGNDQNFTFL